MVKGGVDQGNERCQIAAEAENKGKRWAGLAELREREVRVSRVFCQRVQRRFPIASKQLISRQHQPDLAAGRCLNQGGLSCQAIGREEELASVCSS